MFCGYAILAGSLFYITAKGDVTILMNDDDMLNLMTGKLNPQTVSRDILFAIKC